MKMMRVHVSLWLVLLVGGFLLGFVPEYLKNRELAVSVDLGAGTATSMVWTCDLSAEYVRINAEYRT